VQWHALIDGIFFFLVAGKITACLIKEFKVTQYPFLEGFHFCRIQKRQQNQSMKQCVQLLTFMQKHIMYVHDSHYILHYTYVNGSVTSVCNIYIHINAPHTHM
jgi:hypothetical protein